MPGNNLTVLAADVVVAIGGGAGTLSELCFAWVHDKPICVFDEFNTWAAKLKDQKIDLRRKDKIRHCRSLQELKVQLQNIKGHE